MELEIPLTLRWKQGRDIPFTMTNSIQAVVIDDQVYVGGGYNFDNGRVVMLYTLNSGCWRTLPRYDSVWFGMAAVNNILVLVGGAYSSSRITNVLGAWDEGLRSWTHPYPAMPTPRSQVSVVSHHKWLIVAGGLSDGPLCLSDVEILDTSLKQWYEAASLPIACCAMSSTRNGNTWYLSRGSSSMMSQASNHVFCVNLDELISEAISHSDSSVSTPSPWQPLPDTPLVHSTVVVFRGALLAVGGWKSSSIHLYQPSCQRWIKVGELPHMRYQCACVVLPSGELFVTGGCGDIYSVDIATINV